MTEVQLQMRGGRNISEFRRKILMITAERPERLVIVDEGKVNFSFALWPDVEIEFPNAKELLVGPNVSCATIITPKADSVSVTHNPFIKSIHADCATTVNITKSANIEQLDAPYVIELGADNSGLKNFNAIELMRMNISNSGMAKAKIPFQDKNWKIYNHKFSSVIDGRIYDRWQAIGYHKNSQTYIYEDMRGNAQEFLEMAHQMSSNKYKGAQFYQDMYQVLKQNPDEIKTVKRFNPTYDKKKLFL